MRAVRTMAAMFLALCAACEPGENGTLHARWTSIDTTLGSGDVTLPLTATWCGARGRLTLLALQGDTGVGILVRTTALVPGRFDVYDTNNTSRSPGSAIAFRINKPAALYTMGGDSGVLAITSVREGRIGGRFVGWFSHAGTGPVLLVGNFEGAQPAPDTVRCERSVPPPPPPAVPDSV